MEKIVLYSTHCPKCKVIETKLGQQNISYEIIDDSHIVASFGQAHSIMSAPILVVDGEVMDFVAANKWLNSVK